MRTLVAILILAFAACSCSDRRPKQPDVVDELSHRDGCWKLAGADSFSDGGSFCLSYLSDSGRVLHVFARPDMYRSNGKLVFELRRSYDDSIIILEGSTLEADVLWLLENYTDRREIAIERIYAQKMIEGIKNRTGPFPFTP